MASSNDVGIDRNAQGGDRHQGMIAANGAGVHGVGPFLRERPPVIVDWLPWSHTFGTNFNLTLVLRHGGALYIDEGKPVPGLFDASLRNLASVQPTLLVNVPRRI